MKLDFTALAKETHQQTFINDGKHMKTMLNNDQQYINIKMNNASKLKKSQLSNQNAFMIKSSILSSYFDEQKQKQSKQLSFREPKVNVSVMYPYEVSKSLSPSNIDQQIQDLQSRGILNQSALKFLKKQALKDLQKKSHPKNILNFSAQKNNQSIYIQANSLSFEKDFTSFTQRNSLEKLNKTVQYVSLAENDGNSPINTQLFKHFLHQASQNGKDKALLKPAKANFVNQNNFSYKQKKIIYETPKQPHYMKPTQKDKKLQKYISSQSMKFLKQLDELKQKPSLQMTKNSHFTHKINTFRQSHYRQKKSNVFQSLHNEAYIRECKKSIEKQYAQRKIDQDATKVKKLSTKFSKKYKVGGSFFQRLQRSIQKKCSNNQLRKKYQINQKTGKPFFKPDIVSSRRTYETLFKKSLQKSLRKKQNQEQLLQQPIAQQKQIISKPKTTKANSQLTSSVHYGRAKQSIKQSKQNSVTKKKIAQNQMLSTQQLKSPKKSSNQKSMRSQIKSNQIIDLRNQKVIERVTNIFYPKIIEFNNKRSTQIRISQQNQQQDDFSKTYQSLSLLTQQQYHILEPLFNQIQQLQKSTRVSNLMFKTLLSQYFKKLNFYDQLVLRQPLQVKKKNRAMGIHKAKQFIQSLMHPSQKSTNKSDTYTYHPAINSISSSMDKINPKYQEKLYFV